MLKFYADKFVQVFNCLADIEYLSTEFFNLSNPTQEWFAVQFISLVDQLGSLGLGVSQKKAEKILWAIQNPPEERKATVGEILKKDCKELRSRIQDELEGKAIYYLSSKAELLDGNDPPFTQAVEDAFPSAIYDIQEAAKCLALRRSTASVMHLMRALEISHSCLAGELGLTNDTENWNTILDKIESEIRSRTKATHGEKWKEENEQWFTEAATHFRLIKNAWRNHAQHLHAKYSEEEAEDIYSSVRSFMRHLSERLSEPLAAGQSS